MFKKNWIVYVITDNTIEGVKGHRFDIYYRTKRQAINDVYTLLNYYSFRNIVKIIPVKMMMRT